MCIARIAGERCAERRRRQGRCACRSSDRRAAWVGAANAKAKAASVGDNEQCASGGPFRSVL